MLPSSERQKIRDKYKMSAAAYEKLRQKVKGPEELKQEMEWNELMAQLKFDLETDPHMKEALKKQLEQDLSEQGIEAVLENANLPEDIKKQIESGAFEIDVDSPTEDSPNQLVIAPEGNIGEKLPIAMHLTESYLSQL
jgi:hypothetical protein